jgi:hypothetical protein
MAKAAAKRAPTAKKSDKPDKSDKPGKPVKKAFPMVSRKDLGTLLQQCLIYQNKASTATGSMGELVRSYADKKNLHTGAFSIIKRLHRLGNKDRGKLWLLLAHFDDMREKCGLDRLAQEQGQLLPAIDETESEQQQEPSAEDTAAWNAREVEERAGEERLN